jgi:putative ABC transport system ATP-binding protein
MSILPAIRVHRIGKIFAGPPRVVALRDVTFEVPRGTLCLIEGPSGSGKSTLLGILAGLERPSTGRVEHFGEDLLDPPGGPQARARLRAQVGFVFQDARLISALTVAENVALPLRLRGASGRSARQLSHEILSRFELRHRARQRPGGLSGGERQRVALARALVTRPRILLADEPTASLDTRSGVMVIERLREATRQRDTTAIVVSHDRRLAAHADETFLLLDGSLARRKEERCQRRSATGASPWERTARWKSLVSIRGRSPRSSAPRCT